MATYIDAYNAKLAELHALPIFAMDMDKAQARKFMEAHCFAVWDFMSLMKAVQRRYTLSSQYWYPSRHPDHVIRLINEIVLDEESDRVEDEDGTVHIMSHFSLYVKAMMEVGADVSSIMTLMEFDCVPESRNALRQITQELNLPDYVRNFVLANLRVAHEGADEELLGYFFLGREKIIPNMFRRLSVPKETHWLKQYLDRHIQVDGESHGPLLNGWFETMPLSKKRAIYEFGVDAVQNRINLFKGIGASL